MSADASGAVATYLLTTPAGDAASRRVYRPELDRDVIADMPAAAIVVRPAGGYALFGGANIPLADPRLDIFCYGGEFLEAYRLAAEVAAALRRLRGGTYDGARLYWARIEGGPTPIEDPETRWPCAVVTVQVAHCEVAVA